MNTGPNLNVQPGHGDEEYLVSCWSSDPDGPFNWATYRTIGAATRAAEHFADVWPYVTVRPIGRIIHKWNPVAA